MKQHQSNGHRTPAGNPHLAPVPANNRSRLGNGSALPSGVDGRSSAARRWKEIFRDSMHNTGGRHEQTCRSLASMVLQREALDAALARGEPIDADLLLRLSSEIRRTTTRLGLDEASPEDGTQAAIRALREGREEAHA